MSRVLAVFLFVGAVAAAPQQSPSTPPAVRPPLFIETALREIGVKELPNQPNRSPRIDEYNRAAGAPPGSPWCASFQHWVGLQTGVTLHGAWSPSWFPQKAIIPPHNARLGDFYGIYSPTLKRIAHIGVVAKIDGNRVIGIEGNTNSEGSREGNEVRLKSRLRNSLIFSRWLGQ